MEDVLSTCEQPVQRVQEGRPALPATTEHPRRVDGLRASAGRHGLGVRGSVNRWRVGGRYGSSVPDRTGPRGSRPLQERCHANCERVTLVLDNLHTYMGGALYVACEPERARRLRQRIEFRYTPRDGSWLNVAECEPGCLTRQCLRDRRIRELDQLRSETAAWAARVNQRQRGVNWHVTADDARRKLKSVDPKITE